MIYAVVLACAYAIFMSFWVVQLHNKGKVHENRVRHRELLLVHTISDLLSEFNRAGLSTPVSITLLPLDFEKLRQEFVKSIKDPERQAMMRIATKLYLTTMLGTVEFLKQDLGASEKKESV